MILVTFDICFSRYFRKNVGHLCMHTDFFEFRQNFDFKDFQPSFSQHYWTTQRGRDSEESSGPKFVFSAFAIFGGFFGICGSSEFSDATFNCVGSRDFGRPTLRKKN